MGDEWTQVTGEAGRVYYLNNKTGETSWIKPAAAKVTEEPLPDGWVEKTVRPTSHCHTPSRAARDP